MKVIGEIVVRFAPVRSYESREWLIEAYVYAPAAPRHGWAWGFGSTPWEAIANATRTCIARVSGGRA